MVSFSLGGKNKVAKVAAAIPAFSESAEESAASRVLSPEETQIEAQELQVRSPRFAVYYAPHKRTNNKLCLAFTQVLLLQERGSESALRGDHSAAIRAWDSALALSPSSAAVLHELKAQVYLERDRAWDAVQSASKAASLAPSWPEGHVTLGRSQLNLGEVMR